MKFIALLLMLTIGNFGTLRSQNIPIIQQDSVLNIINNLPDSGYVVINFWATWCDPCVHELPFFIRADTALIGENFTFIFISLDQLKKNGAVSKFAAKMGIPGTLYQMEQTDINAFIEAVDPNWQGAIPYTLILSKNGKKGHEGSFYSYKDLWNFIRFE